MGTYDLKLMLEDLDDNIDDLEAALTPLLQSNLSELSSKLPLFERAKLNVLAAYTIESILFSVLKLNGVDAKEHAIFTELARVKQYYGKIENAEKQPPQKRERMDLDAPAAKRFIQHALAGNEKYDRDRAQQQASERANAQKMLTEMQAFGPSSTENKSSSKKRKADNEAQESASSSSTSPSTSSSEASDVELTAASKHIPVVYNTEGSSSEKIEQAEKEVNQKASVSEADPANLGPPSKASSRKTQGKAHASNSRKQKLSKAPRSSTAVFQDLLHRSAGDKTRKE